MNNVSQLFQKRVQKKQQPAANRQEFNFTFEQSSQLDSQLRKPRSRAFMEALEAVDLPSATDQEIIDALKENLDPETAEEFAEMTAEELLAEIRASIQEEFRTASQDMRQVMYGILAKCRIEGCDCHAISPEGDILAHYKAKRPIPDTLAKARPLFERFPECKCIEVYRDCCRVVMKDSSVIKVQD